MAERPIVFSGPMVRALLARRKTQTRRLVKGGPVNVVPFIGQDNLPTHEFGLCLTHERVINKHVRCPFGVPGDNLWVKETWSDVNLEGGPGIAYRADGHVADLMDVEDLLNPDGSFNYDDPILAFGANGLRFDIWSADLISGAEGNWRSSLHQPRWLSRLRLAVTSIRVERVQDISAEDAKSEGLLWDPVLEAWTAVDQPSWPRFTDPARAYAGLWNDLHGADSWNANPWVWVVTFEVVP